VPDKNDPMVAILKEQAESGRRYRAAHGLDVPVPPGGSPAGSHRP
jgi:hypothetical protein